jgi:hypothetical protein
MTYKEFEELEEDGPDDVMDFDAKKAKTISETGRSSESRRYLKEILTRIKSAATNHKASIFVEVTPGMQEVQGTLIQDLKDKGFAVSVDPPTRDRWDKELTNGSMTISW